MFALRSFVVAVGLAVVTGVSFAQSRPDEPQIAVTARLLTLHISERSDLKFAKLWLSGGLNGPGKPGEPNLAAALKALEDFRTTTVTTLPKVTLVNGQTAEVSTGKPETVITGFDKAGVPILADVHNGTQLKLTAGLNKTGDPIRLNVDAKHTIINHRVPLFPVTTFVFPEGSKPGEPPVPFTQFHAKPDIATVKHGGISGHANGGSRFWDMGSFTVRTERTVAPAALARVPYLNRATASKKWISETYCAFLILTAELIEPAAKVAK